MSSRHTTRALALALLASLALLGCKKDPDHSHDQNSDHSHDEPAAKARTPEPTPAPEPDTTASTPGADLAARAIMAEYEKCRVKLADDDGALSDCAGALAAAANKHAAVLSGAAQTAAGEIAAAATALAEVKADDIEAQRLAFGAVSKPIEALLTATPKVAAAYKMYECPMAKGFPRWAQADMGDKHAMANPYMGKKMLECGSEVHGHHGAKPPAGDHGHAH